MRPGFFFISLLNVREGGGCGKRSAKWARATKRRKEEEDELIYNELQNKEKKILPSVAALQGIMIVHRQRARRLLVIK